MVARLVAQPLGEALGQSVIVENKPGASGLVGTESAASAPPDGYTFVMFVDTNTIFPSTVKQLNHDPLKSFAPITVLGRGSHVIVAHPSLGGAHAARADRLRQEEPRPVLCLAGHRQPAEPVDGNHQECRPVST